MLPDLETRDHMIDELRAQSIAALFHYVPLHSSAAGRRFGRASGDLVQTDEASERLLRLPLWVGMGEPEIERVVEAVEHGLRTSRPQAAVRGT